MPNRAYIYTCRNCQIELRPVLPLQVLHVSLVPALETLIISVSSSLTYPPPSPCVPVRVHVCSLHPSQLSRKTHKETGVALQHAAAVSRPLEVVNILHVSAHGSDSSHDGDVLLCESLDMIIMKGFQHAVILVWGLSIFLINDWKHVPLSLRN